MVTILLEKIIEILTGWLSSFTSWAEDVAEKLGLIEEATEYIDDIYDETTQIQTNTSSIVTSNNRIEGYSFNISNKTNNIDSNVTAIKNNVGSIATSSGVTAAFAEDCATNGLNILDKVTTIASDTTQMRADNVVVKSDLDKIYDALKWSLVGIDTTETVEGIGSISFDTDKTAALNQFDIAFDVVQAGTGDPAPDNVRTLSGWTDFDITANGTPLNLDLNGTYYGGSVNALTGDITKTIEVDLDLSNRTWNTTSTPHVFYATLTGKKPGYNSYLKCEQYSTYNGYFTGLSNNQICSNSTYSYIYIRNDTCDTTTDLISVLHNVKVAYELTTPTTSTATNTLSINTIKGLNTITSDSNGTMTVTYTETVKHYLDKQEG